MIRDPRFPSWRARPSVGSLWLPLSRGQLGSFGTIWDHLGDLLHNRFTLIWAHRSRSWRTDLFAGAQIAQAPKWLSGETSLPRPLLHRIPLVWGRQSGPRERPFFRALQERFANLRRTRPQNDFIDCASEPTPQHAPGARMTAVEDNSLK